MSQKIEKAIILAAGIGSRLKPFTDEVPKCLTEINGVPILVQILRELEKNGIKETAIVIGYLGDVIIKKIGHHLDNMKISYIRSRDYDKTNNMYSLWLARDYLKQGVILIEGDSVLGQGFLKKLLETENDKSYWAGEKFTEKFRGSMSTINETGRIIDVKIVRKQLSEYKDNYYKSTGVLKITPKYGSAFEKWLSQEVKDDNLNIYFDLVIAKHIKDAPIFVFNVTNKLKWAEVDCLDDLKQAEKLFVKTKYVIILIDGAADLPLSELGNKTPFEAANIPNIDALTKNSKTGLMRTMYPGLPLGSIVANLGILGYNPVRYYPNGRASFEALSQGIFLDDNDIAFRCNLVSVKDGILTDFTSKNIADIDAQNIIANLKLDSERIKIYPGQNYRNLLIMKDADFDASNIEAEEPHMNIGKPIRELLIKSQGSSQAANFLNKLMIESVEQVAVLNQRFKTPADMLFLWSPSSTPKLSSFHEKFGIDGAIVSAMDFMHGIGISARMQNKKTVGATGYSDTNLQAKLQDTKNHLTYSDLVFVHINAPDEESHKKNVQGKINIIERIDKEVIGPIMEFLEQKFPNNYRLVILPDHYTFVKNGKHGDQLVPYLVYGKGIKKDKVKRFSEREINRVSKSIIKSYEFMDFLVQGE